jgi:hypothetical protein
MSPENQKRNTVIECVCVPDLLLKNTITVIFDKVIYIIITTINSQPTAGHKPSRSIFGYSHPAPVIRSVANPHSTWSKGVLLTFIETWSLLQNSFTPMVVGSAADMTSPLLLQRVNTVYHVVS